VEEGEMHRDHDGGETYKRVSDSRVTMTELMIPAYANFGGKIHGGILLSLMDKAAYACSSKHAGGYCVTVSVDGVDFLQPVEVGDLISLHAAIHYVGRSSMLIGITVMAEDVLTGNVKHTNTSYFTMVAKGADEKPRQVPGLTLAAHDEVRLFLEGVQRRELKARYKQQLTALHERLAAAEDTDALEGERCLVQIVGKN
jgi:acyl-CoA hydrolase